MIKLFKNAFKLTNEGIILTIPLILFIWIISLYLSYAKNVVDTPPEAASALITLLCMVGAFYAGWFYMVKESIALSQKEFIMDEDRAKAILDLLRKIPAGIGKYFLSFVGMSIISFLIFTFFGGVIYIIGTHFFGSIDFTSPQLTVDQLYKRADWNLLLAAATTLMLFITLLWVPEIIYKTGNPLFALFKSIKKLFCKFKKSFVLFLYLTLLNFAISYAFSLSTYHPLLYMFLMIANIYILVYIVVLIFSYYDKEFNQNEQEESNCDSRSNG